jgi:predicted DsbA family dithiol-disulfide isomerase
MRIDVIFDTVCPWCFIGKRRLEAAVADLETDGIEIHWNAFLLNPDIPPEGMERRAYLRAKFGGESRALRVYSAIARAGASAGIEFNFDEIDWTPNTIDSHRLVRFAQRYGRAVEAVELVFQSYFLDGRDIGKRSVLIDIGRQLGFEIDALRAYLYEASNIQNVLDHNARAHRLGISGVPAFIIDGQFSISGAQEPAVLRRLLDIARERRRELVAGGFPDGVSN